MDKLSSPFVLRIISLLLGLLGLLLIWRSAQLGMGQAESFLRNQGNSIESLQFSLMQQSSTATYRTLGAVLAGVGLFHALRPLNRLEMERLSTSTERKAEMSDVNEDMMNLSRETAGDVEMQTSRGNRMDTASRIMNVSPQTIYWAFVDPDVLVRWLPPKGMRGNIDRFEPQTGGAYRIVLTHTGTSGSFEGKSSPNTDIVEGRFVELVPGEKIVQTAVFESIDPSFAGEMIMTWNLEPIGERTKVTVLCEQVPTGIKQREHERALESTLANLERVVG